MRLLTGAGMGGQVPAVETIYPNPVVTPEMAAAMYAATRSDGMSGLSCTNPEICWASAWGQAPTRGADVDYGYVGLNGVGDFTPAQPVGLFPVTNPLASYGRGSSNGILNGLRGLRGLGALDTSSLTNFVTSVETGSSTDPIFGIMLPNYAWVGGAVLLAVLLGSKAKRGW